ncbi:MAG: class I SAM-dependent methyltransferase [Acidimicrobiales bacterium]
MVVPSEPSGAARRIAAARKLARPARRVLSWFALVDEERVQRAAADAELAAMGTDIAGLRAEVARLEGLVATLRSDFSPIEARTTAHTDLVVGEALRRAEAVDARLATEHQRLGEVVARLDHEHSAILRLLSRDKRLDPAVVGELAPPAIADGLDPRELFEEVERGSREEVVVKFRDYLPLFKDATPVVDLGCGRGEFLELASWVGLDAYGVDADPNVVAACAAAGLRAETGDLYGHLVGLTDASLGGVFCAQVVEHLPAELLEPLFGEVARVLRPGGRVVVETPNAACFSTYVQSFWRDPTHLRPVPAPRLSWAARTAGLVVDEVRFSSPSPPTDRLQLADINPADPDLASAVRSYNGALAQLNYLLYGPQDVALVATKPIP